MMERLPNLIIFLNLLLMASTLANAHQVHLFKRQVKSIFLFGDSLFDPGNNHFTANCTIQADFPPYGSTFFKKPTGRFTNGRTVADFIAQFLGIQLIEPFQKIYQELAKGRKDFPANGLSFASAGSGVLEKTNTKEGVSSLHDQLQQFQTLVEKKYISKRQIENSMFFLESGSNDIFDFHTALVPRLFPKSHRDAILKDYESILEQLCKLGARRIAIFGVGPMGCVPATVLLPHLPELPVTPKNTNPCVEQINDMIKDYNNGLQRLVYKLPQKYRGVTCTYAAIFDITQIVRASPKTYGFANVTDACCGDGPKNGKVQCGLEGYKVCSKPDEYLFWDYFHPTEHTYQLISKAVWDGESDAVRPISIKALSNI